MLTPLQFFTASGGVGSWQQRWVECIGGGDRQRERGERKRENTRKKNKEYYDYITSQQVKHHDVAESYISL